MTSSVARSGVDDVRRIRRFDPCRRQVDVDVLADQPDILVIRPDHREPQREPVHAARVRDRKALGGKDMAGQDGQGQAVDDQSPVGHRHPFLDRCADRHAALGHPPVEAGDLFDAVVDRGLRTHDRSVDRVRDGHLRAEDLRPPTGLFQQDVAAVVAKDRAVPFVVHPGQQVVDLPGDGQHVQRGAHLVGPNRTGNHHIIGHGHRLPRAR